MQIEIPDKLYFKIGEVSKIADVASHVLRYWEREFSDIKPKRAGSKQRLYRREDIELILVIKNLLHVQGYTISGARKLIGDTDDVATLYLEEKSTDIASEISSIKNELIELRELLSKGSREKQTYGSYHGD
jgi:DNA-binding transcriptional MerR regulator